MAGSCCSPKLIIGSASPNGSLGRSRMAAIRTGSPICCPIFCAPASSPLPAATKTPTTSIGCGSIQPSSWRVPAYRITGRDLCSQPTVSRWENAPNLRDLVRLMGVMVDLYCASYATPPDAVTLDIDDTVDVVHGHQQLSLFNAHYDERCFLPIHVYDTA